MGVTQEVHEPEVKSPLLTDNILPEHQAECTNMGNVLAECGKQLKEAKTYDDVRKALHKASVAAEAYGESGLLDCIGNPDDVTPEEVEEYKHSCTTGHEGEE